MSTGIFFWGFLIVYGVIMFVLSPKTVSLGGFFRGEDKAGRDANPWMITASIFIAWIFAKSVTNAANMGQSFGAKRHSAHSAAHARRSATGARPTPA